MSEIKTVHIEVVVTPDSYKIVATDPRSGDPVDVGLPYFVANKTTTYPDAEFVAILGPVNIEVE